MPRIRFTRLRFSVLVLVIGAIYYWTSSETGRNRSWMRFQRYWYHFQRRSHTWPSYLTCPTWRRQATTTTRKQSIKTGDYAIAKYYKHRDKVKYFSNAPQSMWQMSVYMFVGEVGRRLRAKYIVDLGSGKGFKLAKLSVEFNTIGIDFGPNIQTANKSFPSLKWIESDFEGSNCKNDFPVAKSVLEESIVVSSDVIKHILKPDKCYMDILAQAASISKAVILSTPDREVFSRVYRRGRLNGPPLNPCHVREWRKSEMIEFCNKYGMYPLRSGWVCQNNGMCADPTTMLLVLGSDKKLSTDKEKSDIEQFRKIAVNVFLVHIINTQNILLLEVIQDLQKQGFNIILFLNEKDNSQNLEKLEKEGIVVRRFDHVKQIPDIVNSIASTRDSHMTEWNVLMYSNEWIHALGGGLGHPDQLGQFLCWLSKQDGDFNAIAVTTLFYMGKSQKTKILVNNLVNIKVYSETLKPTTDPLMFSIRIWRSRFGETVNWAPVRETLAGQKVITGLSKDLAPSLNVYPYNLAILRVPANENGRRHIKMPEIIDDETPVFELTLGIDGLHSGSRSTLEYLF